MVNQEQPITLETVRAAQSLIAPYIRQTPCVKAQHTRLPGFQDHEIWFKLECLQITGSFKVRGALNKYLTLCPEDQRKPLIAASGGNHGLAVAYTGYVQNVPTTIYLPETTGKHKIHQIQQWGAQTAIKGRDLNEAIILAQQDSQYLGATYIHPFADPQVIRGQGTLGLSILQEIPNVDTLVVAVGGGGLMAGIGVVAKALNPSIKIIGVEPERYPTLYKSLEKGRVVPLERSSTLAVTLAVSETSDLNLKLIQDTVDEVVLISEETIQKGVRLLWEEFFVAAEYSGAAAFSAFISGALKIPAGSRTCFIICGAGFDGIPSMAADF